MLKTDVFYIHTWKYKNESVDIVLRGWGGQWERMVEAENLRYIVSTYVNIMMDSPVHLLYANKINFKNPDISQKSTRNAYHYWSKWSKNENH
jgi:hypothetical protein